MKIKNLWVSQKSGWIKKLRGTQQSALFQRTIVPMVFVRRLVWPAKISLCKVEGIEKNSRLPLAILCGTTAQEKNFFLGLAFDDSAREQPFGRFRLRDVFQSKLDVKKDCSLLIMDSKKSHLEFSRTSGWFFIPVWVTGEVHLPIPDDFLKGDTLKTIFRRTHKHGFEYEITQDEERFEDFHRNMYVPYVTKVHGGAAHFDAYVGKRKPCGNFDLLLVRKKSQPDLFIAGYLIVYEPAGPRLWSLGVRDGNLDYVREGVLAALYPFCFEHLMAKGYSQAHLGSCRTFLKDGVLKFKRKFSQAISGSSWQCYALKILSLTPATQAFLLNNPFMFESDGALHGAIFNDSERPLSEEKIRQIDKDYFHPGMFKLVIYCFRPEKATQPDNIPAALAQRIIIRSADDVVGR